MAARAVTPPRESADESRALGELAKRLADVADTATLLRILLEAVLSQCAAAGAGVGRLDRDEAVVLTTAGEGAPGPGIVFPVAGSVAERAIEQREVVIERQYAEGHFAMSDWGRRAGVGEMMVAPLFAAGQVVGILSAWRRRGDQPFGDEERRRLGVIAHHAANALDKQRLVEAAQAATLAKSNFLAAVSHELRTPLTALAGYGELLADGILGPLSESQHDMVERMRSVTQQLSALIDEILTYSSLEADNERARVRRVTDGEIVHAALAAVEPLAAQRGLELRVSMPGEPTPFVTDPDKVRQILVNLLGNAIKFTDEGTVELSVTSDEESMRFAVRDTGIGIDPRDRARLFQPFVQLDGGLTRRHGGTGLGLYISRRLADLLGGHIDVESRPGTGSTFTVIIPRDAVDDAARD
jgi:signal transduction histidine kinase